MSTSTIDALSAHNQTRMAEILESCLQALEQGQSLEKDALLQANPDLAEPLGKCLTTLMSLHEAVHGVDDTEPSQPLLGQFQQLGDFVLEEQIGRGGMGLVYSATQLSLNRRVAIKLLPNSHLLPATQLQRFLLEARAVAQLQHPHIVPVYSVGQDGGVHYYAMQLIDGHSLEKVDHRYWSEKQYACFLNTSIALCDALAHAHASGVIHRDIKPSNLLLDRNGKIWVTDLGLAQCKHGTRITVTGDLVGTMNYMSPEQAQGKPVDERTDIYSLGVTLYEMLAGQQAFPGNSRPAVMYALDHASPPRLRKLKPEIPYDLETVVLKAMSKDREERYASAADMRADLERIRDGYPIEGRRPSLGQIALQWAKRHRSLVTVGLIGFCTTGVAIVAGAAQVLWSQRELATARQESQLHLATADTNYWHGRNLVEHWQKSLVHRLADIPGAEAIHAQMLAETIDYYQAFLQKSATDPNLASDIAAARAGLAAALASYGDTTQSLVVYQQAIDDLRRLDKQDSTLPLRMATLHNDIAVVLLRNNQALDAVAQLQSAQACLTNASPSTSVASEQLETRAAIHVNLARAYQLVNDGPAEATALDNAESLYRQLLAQSESSTPALTSQHTRSELATVLDQRALLLASTDLENALTISQSAVAMHAENLELNQTHSALPGDKQHLQPPLPWAQRLAASQHNYAVLLWRSGDSDQARQQFQAAIGTKQSLTDRFPDRREHTLDLALSYNGLGKLESKLHNWHAAVANFEQASHSYQTLQPNLTTDNQLMLAETLSNLLQAQLQLQKTDLSDNNNNNNNNNTQATKQQLKDLLGQIERSSLSEPEAATLHRLEVGL